uniref:Uncharacterized protein n=1 Tax=Mesocestoides corti TaxID=53468 RepID=A0A5K3G7K3_MESCO
MTLIVKQIEPTPCVSSTASMSTFQPIIALHHKHNNNKTRRMRRRRRRGTGHKTDCGLASS